MADFDIVVYGATGFTGSLAARYLAEHAPEGLRWAVAGRRAGELDRMATELAASGVIVASSDDEASVREMVARTRVLLTTVGPYARYGTPVVAACAERGVDYVDITGEPPWVRSLIDRFHDAAAERGTRIVPFCGFDSVPGDIGALWMVTHLHEQGAAPEHVDASYKIKGGLNGGTLATFLDGAEKGDAIGGGDPFLLNPEGHPGHLAPEARRPAPVTRDEARSAWLAPFAMAPINTRVVRRSAGLAEEYGQPYGRRFSYYEAAETSRKWAAMITAGALYGAVGVARYEVGRKLLRRVGPKPGEGPSEETMNDGFVRVRYLARAEDGRAWLGTWEFDGDPGNRFTVMSLCESALLLATRERGELPGGAERGGVLTPATALGLPLFERLCAAGVRTTIEPA